MSLNLKTCKYSLITLGLRNSNNFLGWQRCPFLENFLVTPIIVAENTLHHKDHIALRIMDYIKEYFIKSMPSSSSNSAVSIFLSKIQLSSRKGNRRCTFLIDLFNTHETQVWIKIWYKTILSHLVRLKNGLRPSYAILIHLYVSWA